MIIPVRQNCPDCGKPFMGSDAIGNPCPDCSMTKNSKWIKVFIMVQDAFAAGVRRGRDEMNTSTLKYVDEITAPDFVDWMKKYAEEISQL